MENPKTTVAGYLGLLGSILGALGVFFASEPWGQALVTLGLVLSGGANGVGNMMAKDAK